MNIQINIQGSIFLHRPRVGGKFQIPNVFHMVYIYDPDPLLHWANDSLVEAANHQVVMEEVRMDSTATG